MYDAKKLTAALMAAFLCAACGESEADSSTPSDLQSDVQADLVDGLDQTDVERPQPDSSEGGTDEEVGEAASDSDAPGPRDDDTSAVGADDTSAADVDESDVTETAPEDAGNDDPVPDAVDEADDAQSNEGDDAEAPADASTSECSVPCDCGQQGADCIDGQCILGVKPVFCCELEGCDEGEACVTSDGADGLCGVETSSAFGLLVINEVLTDGAVDGDPNADGDAPDATGDEFVELVNAGDTPLDLSGFKIFETNMPFVARHTFEAGTSLNPGMAIVVFGGGSAPDDTGTAQFVVANAADPGIPLGLALNNDGDALSVLDAEGLHVASFSYGPGSAMEALTDESMTRQPDISGPFIGHTWAAGSPDALFSPGTRADGTSF